MIRREDVFSGVFGLAVGDALGVPVEFLDRKLLDDNPVRSMEGYGTHKQPAGTWSDDTSMVLATLDVLCKGRVSLGLMMDRFSKWYNTGCYTADGTVFDIGGTTLRAIKKYNAGAGFDLWGERDERSNGNGSLMRMLPMIYYVRERYGVEITPEAVKCIYEVSSLTHAHMISKVCCVYYVYIGLYILEYGKQKGLDMALVEAIKAVETFYRRGKEYTCVTDVTKLDSLVDSLNLDRSWIKSTGFVVDSLEASIWCLFRTSSYRAAVELAVNLGGDTDTIGAITGSLAGLYYGLENIPKEWLDVLRNHELIYSICDRFYEQYK